MLNTAVLHCSKPDWFTFIVDATIEWHNKHPSNMSKIVHAL
jgi:hypothetical protein